MEKKEKKCKNCCLDALINKISSVPIKMCNFPLIYSVFLKTRSDSKLLAGRVHAIFNIHDINIYLF